MPKKISLKDFIIFENSTIAQAIKLLNISANKCLCVLSDNDKFLGTISDGDIRKHIIKNNDLSKKIRYIYNKKSYVLSSKNSPPKNLLNLFLKYKYDLIPVVDKNKNLIDIITKEECLSVNPKNYKSTDVVIMAGGKGVRLLPFTKSTPKPLLEINGENMIARLINKFYNQNYNNFIISVNYKKNLIKSFINKYKKLNSINVNFLEEKKPLGTIGSLSLINKKNLSNPFIITNSDTILRQNFDNLLNTHVTKKNDFTIIVAKKLINIPFGNIKFHNTLVNEIEEKPKIDLNLNVGFYIASHNVLSVFKKNQKMDANHFINLLIKNKFKVGVHFIEYEEWTEIGRIEEFNDYNNLIYK